MGSIGLIVFAIVVWQGLPRYSLTAVLTTALMAWLLVAVVIWWVRKVGLRNLWLAWKGHATSENKEIR